MSKKAIKDLVNFALSDKTNFHKEIIIGKVSESQAKEIKNLFGFDLQGVERYIDTSAIRHTIKKHGSEKTETSRGQIAINIDDFELIPEILKNPDEIKFLGKNKLKQNVLEYRKKVENMYVVLQAIRESKKKGNRLYCETMYKIKTKKSASKKKTDFNE